MPENPLLPHKKLLELHALMQRCRELDRKLGGRPSQRPAREAMLAAGVLHLQPGDVLCGSADATARALAPPPRPNALAAGKSVAAAEQAARLPKVSRLALCAAMAGGLRAAGTGGIVMALALAGARDLEGGKLDEGKRGGGDSGWAAALDYAQRSQAPLLLLCGDATAGRAAGDAATLTWPAVSKAAKKLRLPVLPVDGEDAVAVYRVVQECAGRARMGEGPAVIWCVLAPRRAALGRAAQPLARMESYLAARGLFPVKR